MVTRVMYLLHAYHGIVIVNHGQAFKQPTAHALCNGEKNTFGVDGWTHIIDSASSPFATPLTSVHVAVT